MPARLGANPSAADASAFAHGTPSVAAIAHTRNKIVIRTRGAGALHPILVLYPVLNASSTEWTDADVAPLSSTLKVAASFPLEAGKDSAKITGQDRAGRTPVHPVVPRLLAERGTHQEVRGGTGRAGKRRAAHT